MPRPTTAATTTSPSPEPGPSPHPRIVKREASASASDSDPNSEDIKPPKKSKTAKKTKAPPRTWTGAELDQLFSLALAHGASKAVFEGKIAGRTGLQCLKTWENTLLPYLHKAAREKGDKKGSSS